MAELPSSSSSWWNCLTVPVNLFDVAGCFVLSLFLNYFFILTVDSQQRGPKFQCHCTWLQVGWTVYTEVCMKKNDCSNLLGTESLSGRLQINPNCNETTTKNNRPKWLASTAVQNLSFGSESDSRNTTVIQRNPMPTCQSLFSSLLDFFFHLWTFHPEA